MSAAKKIFPVVLTAGAAEDLRQIYRYIILNEGINRASLVLEGIQKTVSTISQFPQRGSVPKEIQSVGQSDFRQVFYKTYRIIYCLKSTKVIIYVIADGRQDMEKLLSRRLSRLKR